MGIFYFIIFFIIILLLATVEYTRRILRANIPELFYAISSFIFLLSDIKSSDESLLVPDYTWKEANIFLITTGCIFLFIAFILTYHKNKNQESVNVLKSRLADEEVTKNKIKDEFYNLCTYNIKETFKPFFQVSGGNARISVYRHKNKSFVLLGRGSDNNLYDGRGSEIYPDDEGFIARGWQDKTFQINLIPKYVKSGTEYRRFVKNHCNISDERLKKMKMKSRSFYVYRFDHQITHKSYGVIVFEKMDDSPIPTATIDSIFNTHGQYIFSLMRSMRTLS